jgi:hypothetical protein
MLVRGWGLSTLTHAQHLALTLPLPVQIHLTQGATPADMYVSWATGNARSDRRPSAAHVARIYSCRTLASTDVLLPFTCCRTAAPCHQMTLDRTQVHVIFILAGARARK